MRFSTTGLPGVYLIQAEPAIDERGFFARLFCEQEFSHHGLVARYPQVSLSYNHRRGTVRGIHFQLAPYEEAKIICCLRGAIFDVAVDLRRDSATFGQAFWTVLRADEYRMLYIPKGFGHGFQTLTDETVILYFISEFYQPGHARGIRWDDPDLGIPWPEPVTVISDKDRRWPSLREYMAQAEP